MPTGGRKPSSPKAGPTVFGNTGTAFTIVTRKADGSWTVVARETGVFVPLKTRANGWLEIMVGGPGFSHPVVRFNGKEYVRHRQMTE